MPSRFDEFVAQDLFTKAVKSSGRTPLDLTLPRLSTQEPKPDFWEAAGSAFSNSFNQSIVGGHYRAKLEETANQNPNAWWVKQNMSGFTLYNKDIETQYGLQSNESYYNHKFSRDEAISFGVKPEFMPKGVQTLSGAALDLIYNRQVSQEKNARIADYAWGNGELLGQLGVVFGNVLGGSAVDVPLEQATMKLIQLGAKRITTGALLGAGIALAPESGGASILAAAGAATTLNSLFEVGQVAYNASKASWVGAKVVGAGNVLKGLTPKSSSLWASVGRNAAENTFFEALTLPDQIESQATLGGEVDVPLQLGMAAGIGAGLPILGRAAAPLFRQTGKLFRPSLKTAQEGVQRALINKAPDLEIVHGTRLEEQTAAAVTTMQAKGEAVNPRQAVQAVVDSLPTAEDAAMVVERYVDAPGRGTGFDLTTISPDDAATLDKALSVLTPSEGRILIEPAENRGFAISEELVTTADAFTDIFARQSDAVAPENLISIPDRTVTAPEGLIPVQRTKTKDVIQFESDIDAALYEYTARANRPPKRALADFLESNFNMNREQLLEFGKRVRKEVNAALKRGLEVPTVWDSVIEGMNLPRPGAVVDLLDNSQVRNITGKLDGALKTAYDALDNKTTPFARRLLEALNAKDPAVKARILEDMQKAGDIPTSPIGAKVDIERNAQRTALTKELTDAETALKKAQANRKRILSDNARKETLGQPPGSTKRVDDTIADLTRKVDDINHELEVLRSAERVTDQEMRVQQRETEVLAEKAVELQERVNFNGNAAVESALSSMYRRLNSLKKITRANEDLDIPLERAVTTQSASYQKAVADALRVNDEISAENFVADELDKLFKEAETYVETGVLTRDQVVEWEGKARDISYLLDKKQKLDFYAKNEPSLIEEAVSCILGIE